MDFDKFDEHHVAMSHHHYRSLLQSWLALPQKTRLSISLVVCFVGVAGIAVSDHLEKTYSQPEKK
ncbi:hypothetical protein Ac2012v2_000878 [Leucoagaricus gongylophorus]